MKILVATLATVSVLFSASVYADDERTVTTTATCAKCDLKEATACLDVIKIDGKWLDLTGTAAKGFHRKICKSAKTVIATGKVQGSKFNVSKLAVKE